MFLLSIFKLHSIKFSIKLKKQKVALYIRYIIYKTIRNSQRQTQVGVDEITTNQLF